MRQLYRSKEWLISILLVISILTIGMATMLFGKTSISLTEFLFIFKGDEADPVVERIVMQLRLPRYIIAVLAGSMLGLAGVILQSITKNPLAEPSIIGVTSGSVLAAVLAITMAPSYLTTSSVLPVFACIGGLIATLLVFYISNKAGNGDVQIALIGVLISSILQATTSFILLTRQEAMGSVLLWVIGSLNGRVWIHVYIILPFALIGITLGLLSASLTNGLRLGDTQASLLGLPVKKTRLLLLGLSAILTAGAVSVVGAIGFIGLIGPHLAKRFVGEDARKAFPLSILISALILAGSDFIAQNLIVAVPIPSFNQEAQLPAGAITALLGAPFFLYILRKHVVKRGG
ncbi:FecCD family ABC transporter permease [Halalkalibacter sp. AB-rgal2]|uniref:FecCD family ABC transporter permease n=1 Tax=Halalkalibacter sp. AB-rgal2 TaxID=3242695 RepID=UPI00359DF6F1